MGQVKSIAGGIRLFIQKAQSTIANSQPPDPRPVAPASPQFSLTPSNPPRTMNYTAPPSANAPDTKTPAFHKTLGTRVSAPGLRGFLRYTLHTEGNTARYWSDKTEDEDCFSPSGNFLVLVSPQLSHSYRSIRNSSFKYSW